MAHVVCVLYDDPVDGYPPSYARADIPRIDHYFDGQTTPTVAGRAGHRLDTTTSERTQTVVTWPAAQPNMVNVVITNDLPDARIQDAIDAFGGK